MFSGWTSSAAPPDALALRRKMQLATGGVLLMLLAQVYGVMALPPLLTYVNGTPTTAHVGVCRASGGVPATTTCSGSWTFNGIRHSGEIEGAEQSDEGQDVPVHATADSAATEDTLTTTEPIQAAMFAIAAFAFVVAAIVLPRRSRPPYQPGPYQPGPYQPSPPRQGPRGRAGG